MSRIIDPGSSRSFILALDHGFTMGPLPGLENVGGRMRDIGKDAPDAVILHQGMVARVSPLFQDRTRLGLIVHLSGATQLSPDPNDKQIVCTVPHALRLGADAVSIHVNLGARTENQMLADMAVVSQACQEWGVPLLAMMYPRGEKIRNPNDPDLLAHALRVAMELGADLIKIPYTGDRASFARILEPIDVPVVVAGGARLESEESVLRLVDDVLQAGAAGVSFGRNIFQSPNPGRLTRAMAMLLHQRAPLAEGLAVLKHG